MKQQLTLTILVVLASNSAFADSEQKAVVKMFKSYGHQLKAELKWGLKKGPSHAVDVCKDKAPKIAAKVSTDKIKIGRVSHKPRNSNNVPWGWMAAPIQSYLKGNKGGHKSGHKSGKNTSKSTGKNGQGLTKVKIDNGKVGYLMPIKTGPLCLTCHGKNVASGLRKDILKAYPNDKALGFEVGEIRGFFFAEISK